ncbi:MAG TPA: sulfatase [Tepidisphaeraceae bacterium]|nr:sulfatase [Tepidisphaeraceae bacterium]
MARLWFTVFILALLAVPALSAERPNVLFISVDDLNMNVGCYGDTIVKTPNIDRLASRGVRFDRAYCQYPLCNPSRASLMTGLRPDTIGVYDLGTNFRSTVPNIVTLPQLFRNNGYFAARVGKLYHYGVPREIGTDGMDDPASWDYTFNPLGRDKTEEEKLHVLTRGTGKGTIGFAMAWLDMEGSDEEQTDAIGVTHTIGLLEKHREQHGDKPFFIGMGFFRPHTPFVATRQWFEKYPLDSIKLPHVPEGDLKDIPDIALMIRPPNYGLDEKGLKQCVRGYIASVAALDAQVGRLLEALERLKLADNTIVVFWSDHGFLLGEHGQWQKQMLFEEANRVPLIISAPGRKAAGGVAPGPVELLDVYPTLAELCGLKPPHELEGKSLAPLLDEPATAWERPAFSQVTRRRDRRPIMGYSVRTDRWRYTQWGRNGAEGQELYDHENDPKELTNLAADPALANVVVQLAKLIEPHRARFLARRAAQAATTQVIQP